jgi:hypothetical protein
MTGLPNLGGKTIYFNTGDIDYYLHQRMKPVPKEYRDIPELSGFGVKILMRCKGVITEEPIKFRPKESVSDQTLEIAYKKFHIDITPEGAKSITPKVIEKAWAILEYAANR